MPGALFLRAFLFSFLVIVAALPVFAQSLHARVTDRGGLAVPAALVTIESDDHRAMLETDLEGRVRLDALPPGRYVVSAEVRGFKKARRTIWLDEDVHAETMLRVHRYKGRSDR